MKYCRKSITVVCNQCRNKVLLCMMQSHHLIPKSKGGNKTKSLCANCHAKETSKQRKEWGWKNSLHTRALSELAHCYICNYQGLGVTFHHIIPRAVNGPDTDYNRILLCPNHHEITKNCENFKFKSDIVAVQKDIRRMIKRENQDIDKNEIERIRNKFKDIMQTTVNACMDRGDSF